MDVERIQKINDLALDLVNQGLAKDKEEAIRQAEEILKKKDYTSLKDTVDSVQENKPKEDSEKDETPLGQDEIKNILKKNVDFIVKKMKGFNEQIKVIENSMDSLKSEIQTLSARTRNLETRGPAAPIANGPEIKPKTPVQKSMENGSVDHPRSGSYVDNDVSIEKFFYSGSKPRD